MLPEKHKARVVMGARKVGQSATACLVLMTKGDLSALTPSHWLNASKTGALGAGFAILLTFTPIARLYSQKWMLAGIAGVSTFFADWWAHGGATQLKAPSTEAVLTGVGAFFLSLVVSLTPVGARIERLAAKFNENP